MLILALDSSGKSLSIALREDGRLIAERYLNLGYTHSQTLMPQLLSLLKESSKDFVDLSAIAVCQGPGSYTGIRIGLTTAKTLAWALKIPLYAFSSLEILRFSFIPLNKFILPCIDARRGRCFSECYRGSKVILPQANRSVVELLEELKDIFYAGRKEIPDVYLVGDAASEIMRESEQLKDLEKHIKLGVLTDDLSELRASKLAHLAEISYSEGNRPGWQQAKADYASPTQAERVRKEYLKSIKIRPAIPADLDELEKIENSCFPTPWSRKALADQLSPENKYAHLYVAYEENEEDFGRTEMEKASDGTEKISKKILAYGGFLRHIDEGDILNIAVLPEVRRKGIARKLLRFILAEANSMGIERLILEVRESNLPAQELYKSMGFKVCGRCKNYYDKPREDALLMDLQ